MATNHVGLGPGPVGMSADADFLRQGNFSNWSCFYISGIEYLTVGTVCIHVGRKG